MKCFFIVLLCFSLTPVLHAAKNWPSFSDTTEFASDVVFKYASGGNLMHARRWHGPVTIVILTDDDYEELAAISDAIEQLNVALQGTDVQLVLNPGAEPWCDQSITFVIGDRGFRNRFRRAHDCEGHFHSSLKDENLVRTKSAIFIDPRENPKEAFLDRVNVGLLGVMGMPDQSEEVKESILFQGRRMERLTEFDCAFVHFYHTHIKEGMTRQQVKDAVRDHWDSYTPTSK